MAYYITQTARVLVNFEKKGLSSERDFHLLYKANDKSV